MLGENANRNCIYKLLRAFYRVCLGFRFPTRDDYFQVDFDPFLKRAPFFEAAGAATVVEISLRISNCNQVKLVQILGTHCRTLHLWTTKKIYFLIFIINYVRRMDFSKCRKEDSSQQPTHIWIVSAEIETLDRSTHTSFNRNYGHSLCSMSHLPLLHLSFSLFIFMINCSLL